jgi:hypothetical protein
VNLRPESDPETKYVSFDRPLVLRVPARIIADLEGLAGFPPIAEEDVKKGSVETRRALHRRRLAEPDPPAKPLTVPEERAAPRLTEAPAIREGLNEPRPGLLIGMFLPPVPAAFFARQDAPLIRKSESFDGSIRGGDLRA